MNTEKYKRNVGNYSKPVLIVAVILFFILYGMAAFGQSNIEVKNIYIRDAVRTPVIIITNGDTTSIYNDGDTTRFNTENPIVKFNKPIKASLYRQGADTLTTNKALRDTAAAIRVDIGSSGEPLYEGDSTQLKEDIRELLTRTDTTQELVARTIYINQTTGNDTTGNGLIGAPFRTFGKAITTVKSIIATGITFNFSVGTHNINKSDIDYITDNYYFKGRSFVDAYIILQGTNVNLLTGLSCTRNVNNRFIMDVTGVTWAVNQYEGKFLNTGTNYYPIESNTATSLTGALYNAATGTYNISEDSTTLNFIGLTSNIGLIIPVSSNSLSSNGLTASTSIRFQNCKIKTNTVTILSGIENNSISFFNCYFNSSYNNILINNIFYKTYFRNCFIKFNQTGASASTLSSAFGSYVLLHTCVLKNTVNTGGIGFTTASRGTYNLNYSVVSNFYKAISYTHDGEIGIASAAYFKDCNYLLYSNGKMNAVINLSEVDFYLSGITNLLYSTNIPTQVILKLYSNSGFTNIWATASPFKGMLCDPSKNINIVIPGTYPEYQQKQSVTLANNSTDSISIADLTYNRAIELKYTIQRGIDYRTGTCKILNTGTTYLFDPGDYIESADIGVTLNGVYQSGGSNTLKLKWTTTNTGTACTFIYDAFRQNF